MTENGDSLENAIAERVNGIKEEYLNDYQVDNLEEAKELLDAFIQLYNNERLHMGISYLTPNHQVHQNNINRKIICKKPCYCKSLTGLKISCKSILGLSINMYTYFRTRHWG